MTFDDDAAVHQVVRTTKRDLYVGFCLQLLIILSIAFALGEFIAKINRWTETVFPAELDELYEKLVANLTTGIISNFTSAPTPRPSHPTHSPTRR